MLYIGEDKYPIGKGGAEMQKDTPVPLLKTVTQMSEISGLGEKKLLSMIHNREIDYVKNGNRFLLTEQGIWGWYSQNKVSATRKRPSANRNT